MVYVGYSIAMFKYIVALLALVLLGGGVYWYGNSPPEAVIAPVSDPKNATYEIQGKKFTLENGNSIIEDTPTSKTITAYFGNEAQGDLDNDGDEDVAFILIQNGGGSGTFVYVVAALKSEGGYVGTNGILLGDRISPQTTAIENGVVIVNYADRRPDEPMATKPSVGVTLRAKIEEGRLVSQ